jgi:hypothetical protein
MSTLTYSSRGWLPGTSGDPDTRPDLSEYRALHRVRLDSETLLRERLG